MSKKVPYQKNTLSRGYKMPFIKLKKDTLSKNLIKNLKKVPYQGT